MLNALKWFAFCFTLLVVPFPNDANGKLTYTQNLIRVDITRLGGEWEGGEEIERICFLGPNFKSDHFEMLSHCAGLKWFSAFDVGSCDKVALKHLFKIKSLQRIDVSNSGELADGFEYLPANTAKLKEVRIEASTLGTDAILALQRVKSLSLLSLTLREITVEQVDALVKMKQLKHLWIETKVPIDDSLLKHIESSLGTCEVLVTVVDHKAE